MHICAGGGHGARKWRCGDTDGDAGAGNRFVYNGPRTALMEQQSSVNLNTRVAGRGLGLLAWARVTGMG